VTEGGRRCWSQRRPISVRVATAPAVSSPTPSEARARRSAFVRAFGLVD
jgi:hypothetical protein